MPIWLTLHCFGCLLILIKLFDDLLFNMCLAIPMQIKSINGTLARCEAKGVQRDVSLFMMQQQNLAVDDFVMVHVGYAISKVEETEALSAWETYDQMQQAGR